MVVVVVTAFIFGGEGGATVTEKLAAAAAAGLGGTSSSSASGPEKLKDGTVGVALGWSSGSMDMLGGDWGCCSFLVDEWRRGWRVGAGAVVTAGDGSGRAWALGQGGKGLELLVSGCDGVVPAAGGWTGERERAGAYLAGGLDEASGTGGGGVLAGAERE